MGQGSQGPGPRIGQNQPESRDLRSQNRPESQNPGADIPESGVSDLAVQ